MGVGVLIPHIAKVAVLRNFVLFSALFTINFFIMTLLPLGLQHKIAQPLNILHLYPGAVVGPGFEMDLCADCTEFAKAVFKCSKVILPDGFMTHTTRQRGNPQRCRLCKMISDYLDALRHRAPDYQSSRIVTQIGSKNYPSWLRYTKMPT